MPIVDPVTRLSVAMMLVMGLAACSASPPPGQPPPPPASTGVGTIAGRVVIDGAVPAAERVRFDADPQCVSLLEGEPPTAEDLVVGASNAVQNVFVYIKEGLVGATYPVPADAVTLDQRTCRFTPRVVGVQVGQTLKVRNSDPLLHTVRGDGTANGRFNVATMQGIEITRVFKAPEVVIPIGCDLHPWMRAWVGVLPHPFFAVTDRDGRFTIASVPSGTYVVEFWHERLGTQMQRVTVTDRGTAEMTIALESR